MNKYQYINLVFILILTVFWMRHAIRVDVAQALSVKDYESWVSNTCRKHGGSGDFVESFEDAATTTGQIYCAPMPPTTKNSFLVVGNSKISTSLMTESLIWDLRGTVKHLDENL